VTGDWHDPDRPPVPPEVEALVDERRRDDLVGVWRAIEALDRRMLELGSAAPRRFTVHRVAATAGVDEARVAGALRRLSTVGAVAEEQVYGDPQYRFVR
jgi:hypothetical protein